MAKKGYHQGACECDLRFHQLLVAASGNTRLLQAYLKSNIPLFHTRQGRSHLYRDDFDATDREHRLITDALRRRARDQGVKVLKAHFRRGETGMLGV